MNYEFNKIEEISTEDDVIFLYQNDIYNLRLCKSHFAFEDRYRKDRLNNFSKQTGRKMTADDWLEFELRPAVPTVSGYSYAETNGISNAILSGSWGLNNYVRFEEMPSSGAKWHDLYLSILAGDRIVRKLYPGKCLVQSEEDKEKHKAQLSFALEKYYDEQEPYLKEHLLKLGYNINDITIDPNSTASLKLLSDIDAFDKDWQKTHPLPEIIY